MLAEFTVELGPDDPTLAVPWHDPQNDLSYLDLRTDPETIDRVGEARFSEMRQVLAALNASPSPLQTAKCDVYFSEEISEEEAVFGTSCKFGSYVDAFFYLSAPRRSFPMHEAFARRVVELLRKAPELQASFEVIIRAAHFENNVQISEGFYFTLYTHGYGDDEAEARQAWGIALKLVVNAILQISSL